MVRIKHRYLLINILYPDPHSPSIKTNPSSHSTATPTDDDTIPYTLQFHRPSPDTLNPKLLIRHIRDTVSDLFGDYGAGTIGSSLQLKYFSPATSTLIIRISREHYRLVWAALTYTTHLPLPLSTGRIPCVFQVIRVSGTIRKAEEEAVRRARVGIRRVQIQGKGKGKGLGGGSGVETGEEGLDVSMRDGIEDIGEEDNEDGDEDDEDD